MCEMTDSVGEWRYRHVGKLRMIIIGLDWNVQLDALITYGVVNETVFIFKLSDKLYVNS